MAKKIHLISIGGSVMHNLAIALHSKGFVVTGSDDEIYDPARSRLQKYKLLPQPGWNENKIICDLEAVIVGMHAKGDNPELLRARQLNLPIFSFPEYMYRQAEFKTRVVVAGSHGKTTVTSMLLHLFKFWGRKADYLVGAQLEGFETMVNLDPQAETAIFEGDEYLASPLEPIPKFLFYKPHIAVITGIAWDHINAFPTYQSYLDQFEKFIASIQPGGHLIYNGEDEELRKIVEKASTGIHKIAYTSPRHTPAGSVLEIQSADGKIKLPMIGTHNAANFEAARQVVKLLGFSHDQIAGAMASFAGPANRLQIKTQTDRYVIINDFAHAPSKVRASVAAVRQHFPRHQLIAILELHTFSSLTPEFLPNYKGTLQSADAAFVYLNPHALLKKGSGVSENLVSQAFGFHGLMVSSKMDEIKAAIASCVKPPVTFLMMSSGNWGGEDWRDLPTFVLPEQNSNQ